jgi:flagellar biosynthesis/type III secretory pathway M-ring protein FliF/YscJ
LIVSGFVIGTLAITYKAIVPEQGFLHGNPGSLLSKTDSPEPGGEISNQLLFKRKLEDYYTSKAMGIVRKITDSKNTIVNVSADLDSEQTDNKQAKIKRLSVSVLVNSIYKEERLGDGKTIGYYIERPKEELDQIAAIIKQTIGIDEASPRNDEFEIQNIQFNGHVPVLTDVSKVKEEKRSLLAIIKNSFPLIAVFSLVLFAFTIRVIKRLSAPKMATHKAPLELPDSF